MRRVKPVNRQQSSCGSFNMMTYQVNASLPAAKEGRVLNCSRRGPHAAGRPVYRNPVMGTGGGRASLRQNANIRGTFPVIRPMSQSRDWKALVGGIVAGGSPDVAKDDALEPETVPEKDICGRHFVFDNKCARLERSRTLIPPLPRDYHVNRRGTLHPISLSRELSHSHAGRPLTLGYPQRYELNMSPAVLFPSALVLNGRNTFVADNCKLSRPVLSRPDGRSLSLLYPQDIRAVLFGGRNGKTRKAQKNEEGQKTSILTITYFPVTLLTDQNLRVCAKDT